MLCVMVDGRRRMMVKIGGREAKRREPREQNIIAFGVLLAQAPNVERLPISHDAAHLIILLEIL